MVLTNPHMLHTGILPNHTKWQGLFTGLRFVVVDELHTLSGIFGSHVANVLRRLQRICAHALNQPIRRRLRRGEITMKRIGWTVVAAIVALLQFRVTADEGMWTFDNPPLAQWKARYGFEPSAAWLEHVRLASVRLNDGGSASFVSPNGLLMTNQHVASGQLQKVSTPEHDYTLEGFYARSRNEELKCPDLEANVLVSYENVTARVKGAVTPGARRA